MPSRRAGDTIAVSVQSPSNGTSGGGGAPASLWLKVLFMFGLEVAVFSWSRLVTIHNEANGWKWAPPIPTSNPHNPNYRIAIDNRNASSISLFTPVEVDNWLREIDPGLKYLYHTDYIAPFWLPDSALSILGCCLFVPLIAGGLSRLSSTIQILERLVTIMCCHVTLIAVRTLSMWSTIGRAAPVCYSLVASIAEAQAGTANWITVIKPAWMFNHGCYDMMFSGHAATGVMIATFIHCDQVLSVLVANRGAVWPTLFRAFCWCWAVVNSLGQVITGEHWSTDVVVGVAVAAGVWLLWRERMAWTYRIGMESVAGSAVPNGVKGEHNDKSH